MFRRFASVITLCLFASIARAQTPPEELQILFIGNSLTHYNDLPKMLVQLAKDGKQRPILFEQVTPGGCTLEKHWTDGKALAKIQSRKWDYVVIQEYSSGPVLKRASMFEYGKKLDAEVRKQDAKTLWYMTWANLGKGDDQATISKAYLELAGETKAEVALVGKAWEAALLASPPPALHMPDKKHPTPAGTYLAACVFYAMLYNKSPEGLPGDIAKLTAEQAKALQMVAWKTVEKKGP